MVLKPVQFNQVCKCMAYIENLIMQPEWKIDAVSLMAQKRPLPNRWGMYSSQLCQISLKTYIIQTKWFFFSLIENHILQKLEDIKPKRKWQNQCI